MRLEATAGKLPARMRRDPHGDGEDLSTLTAVKSGDKIFALKKPVGRMLLASLFISTTSLRDKKVSEISWLASSLFFTFYIR